MRRRYTQLLGWAVVASFCGCSLKNFDSLTDGESAATGGSASGGKSTSGGTVEGGGGAGGENPVVTGGTSTGGADPLAGSAGRGATAGTAGSGGAGGADTGGTGGVSATGGAAGAVAGGGAVGTGATSTTGGTVAGTGGTGGAAGASGTGGGAGVVSTGGALPTCLPTTFDWNSSPPVIGPRKSVHLSLKEPTAVFHDGMYHVFATVFDSSLPSFNMVYLTFANWEEAGTASQFYMGQLSGWSGRHFAPQLFYFAPQQLWYIIQEAPSYSTSTDLSDPQSWTPPQPLLTPSPVVGLRGGAFWVICDDAYCYLFFTTGTGELSRSQTPVGSFPQGFGAPVVVMDEGNANRLWHSVEVYKIQDSDYYMMLAEARGTTGSYFRSWLSTELGGDWSPYVDTEANPFAGASNVSFVAETWTDDVGHGEFVRHNVDQTMTIDACGDLEFLYQGVDPTANSDLDSTPYRLGVLTPTGQPPVTARMPDIGAGGAGGAGGAPFVDYCPRDDTTAKGGASGAGGAGGAAGGNVFQMAGDQVVIEAEHFVYGTDNGSGKFWTVVTDSNASNGARIDLLPDTVQIWPNNDLLNTPRVDFDVNFTSSGTYYFWIRGGGINGDNDSCWGGVDCEILSPHFWPLPNGETLIWISISFTVDSPGLHSVQIWGREDGFMLDKIVISKSATAPTGTGPAESPRE